MAWFLLALMSLLALHLLLRIAINKENLDSVKFVVQETDN